MSARLLACCLAVLLAVPAAAEPPSPGLKEAVEHYQAQRYGPAAKAFEKEHAQTGRPWLLFNIAECYRGLYNQTLDREALRKARESYLRYLEIEPRGNLADKARRWQAVVESELAKLPAPAQPQPQPQPQPAPPAPPPAAPAVPPKLLPAPRPPAPTDAPPPPPPPSRWWIWTAAGAAVLAGTVTAIVLATRPARVDAPVGGEFTPQPYD